MRSNQAGGRSLSLAIVFRNEARNLPALLQSFDEEILDQLGIEEECHFLFVDNESSDNSAAIIKNWASQGEKKLTYLYRDLNHMALARDQAINSATSEWLVFVDGDSVLQPGWWSNLNQAIDQVDSDVAMIGGKSEYTVEEDWHSFVIPLSQYFPLGKKSEQKVYVDHVPTNNAILRVGLIKKVGGFDSYFHRVGEDLELSVRIKKSGFKTCYHPIFWVWHRLSPHRSDWYRKMVHYGRAQAFVFSKHFGSIPLEKFLPLIFIFMLGFICLVSPMWFVITLILLLLSPRLRFYFFSFSFYGLGEMSAVFEITMERLLFSLKTRDQRASSPKK
jgi:GT2 family glycosyltransferase